MNLEKYFTSITPSRQIVSDIGCLLTNLIGFLLVQLQLLGPIVSPIARKWAVEHLNHLHLSEK